MVFLDSYGYIEQLKVGYNYRGNVRIIDDLFWIEGIVSLIAAEEHLTLLTFIIGPDGKLFTLKTIFRIVGFEGFRIGIEPGHTFISAQP